MAHNSGQPPRGPDPGRAGLPDSRQRAGAGRAGRRVPALGANPDIARQAVAVGATALWLQLGIASEESRAIAAAAGLLYVEDRCLVIERRRLGLEAPR